MNTALAIFIGGGLGSLARFGVTKASLLVFNGIFPLGTLLANILSCAVVALVLGYFQKEVSLVDGLKPLILVGFCGGFSTFSTFSYETFELIRMGNWGWALTNILISVLLCILLFYILLRN